MTPNLDFKFTIFFNVTYLENGIDWCHFNAPNPDLKGKPLFEVEYLENDTRYGHSYCGTPYANLILCTIY